MSSKATNVTSTNEGQTLAAANRPGRRAALRLRRRREAGQSLIVAIIVLFLLLFLGGIFIALIARNLRQAQRAAQVTGANQFAEGGIRYLDDQLVKSPEGADWRAIPDSATNPNDPDYFWIKPLDTNPESPTFGEGGFTRVTFGGTNAGRGNLGGRALVRVTYEPWRATLPQTNPRYDPNAKYIKIESVGRVGVIDPNDPTTFGNTQRAGLRRELVAYKSVGILDYARFVTNKDRKPNPTTFGSPRLVLDRPRTGASTQDRPEFRDILSETIGPVRVNGDVVFYGENYFSLDPSRNDVIEVTGRIRQNDVDSTTTMLPADPGSRVGRPLGRVFVQDARRTAPNAANTNPLTGVFPSDSANFSTVFPTNFAPGGGTPQPVTLVRDGVPGFDANGRPRAVSRLEPPVIDTPIGPNGLTRYRALTRNAPPMAPAATGPNTVTINPNAAGFLGWGNNLYINNAADTQTGSGVLAGTSSPRSDWLQPNNAGGFGRGTSGWVGGGDYQYDPPATEIELSPRFLTLTQYVEPSGGRLRPLFREKNGNPLRGVVRVVRYAYEPDLGNNPAEQDPQAGLAPTTPKFAGYPEGDFVIFAEGNLRVRGVAGGLDPETRRTFLRHLTIVSNGTIYVDGNLLRDNLVPSIDGQFDQRRPPRRLGAVRGRSSIALLARDYICVNTTQFLSPGPAPSYGQEAIGGESFRRISGGDQPFPFRLTPGSVDKANTPPPYFGAATDQPGLPSSKLLLRHSSEFTSAVTGGQGAAINVFLNYGANGVPSTFSFASAGALRTSLVVPSEGYVDQVFDFGTNSSPLLFPNTPNNGAPYPAPPLTPVGLSNLLAINYDVGYVDPDTGLASNSAYKVSRVGVVPLDIRVEAFMYAQEQSFFIIPGPWFNPDPNDTYETYISDDPATGEPRLRRAGEGTLLGQRRISHLYPFYRQPLDVRMTFFGSVAENQTAQTGDQSAWLEKWGWVPRFMGSTGLSDIHDQFLPEGDARRRGVPPLPAAHGPRGLLSDPVKGANPTPGDEDTRNPNNVAAGGGLLFEFDDRAILPYARNADGTLLFADNGLPVPLRTDTFGRTLPIVPRLPVAQGLLFFGENPVQDR